MKINRLDPLLIDLQPLAGLSNAEVDLQPLRVDLLQPLAGIFFNR